EANPGIHFAEIVRRVGAGNGNTEHHLRHLVAQKVLGEVEAKGYTCYYVPGSIGADTARALPAVKSRGARAILSTIAAHPGVRAQDVARLIGMTEPTVHYHVVRLRDVGLVDAKRDAKGIGLHPTSTAYAVLPIAA
ncbi:MAG TPA: winged helix-turn-helix transcriptional regulator, partial [Candidatus Thermoplasmatota archaeon]